MSGVNVMGQEFGLRNLGWVYWAGK